MKRGFGQRFSRLTLPKRFGRIPLSTALFIARFTPAIKMPVFIYSGWIRYPLIKYVAWLLSLTLIQIGAVCLLLSFHQLGPMTRLEILKNALVIYVTLFLLFRTLIFLFVHRKRVRLHLRAKIFWWLRYHNRQFWPLWLVYVPLYFYLPILGLKHRSLWAWLYVNPALPNGGWWGEKKSEIDSYLKNIMSDCYLPGQILEPATFLVQPEDEQRRRLKAFSYPLVSKPDRGKQGQGVRVVHDANQLGDIVRECDETLFLQSFDASPGEAGLMFYRLPKTQRIHLFSVTDKKFPFVTGDGVSNIFELILRDKRARFIAPIYLEQCRVPLHQILPHGQVFQLTCLGNHSKGALFYSDEALKTPQLEERLNQLLASAKGIDFGRFDIKYTSRQSLMEGHFKIIELNGAGAESTNIHDPKFRLLEFYKILFKQWDLLFLIGKPEEKSFRESVLKLARWL